MSLSTRLTAVAIGLSVLTIVMAALAFLALLDIAQGSEPDLALERAILWLAVVVIIPTQITLIWTVIRLRRSSRRTATGEL